MPKAKTKSRGKKRGRGLFDSIGNAFKSIGNKDTYKPLTNAVAKIGNKDTYKPLVKTFGDKDKWADVGNKINGYRNKALDLAKLIPGANNVIEPWKKLENAANQAVGAASNKDSWNKIANDPAAVWHEDVNPWLKEHKVLSNIGKAYLATSKNPNDKAAKATPFLDEQGYGMRMKKKGRGPVSANAMSGWNPAGGSVSGWNPSGRGKMKKGGMVYGKAPGPYSFQ